MLRIGEGNVSPLISKVDSKSPERKGLPAPPLLRRELGPKEAGPAPLMTSRSSSLLSRGSECKIAGMYDLEETLGRGHFAVVKLARHVFTGEKVAVKVIDKTKLDEVSRAHLFQEVRCMKLVQHPNVVRLYEVIDTQTKLYLILELADGGDLYDYIMRYEDGLGEDKARNYFRQIVHAISYCHKLHVVHRDLKPENVVFFEQLGMVKLTDFGFSNKFNPGQKLETSCGSLAYSAPEILLGDSYDAPAVDVWSLGVILYMLVCGHAPFQEANDSETLTMIMDCKYSMPSYVSKGCCNLIARMLVREPDKRASLEELAKDPWLQEGSGVQPSEYLPLISREHVSEEDHNLIIQKMVSGKIAAKEEILEALDKNEYNHITATYFLLAERKLRSQRQEQAQKVQQGGKSLAASPNLSMPNSSNNLILPHSISAKRGSPRPAHHQINQGSPGDLILPKPTALNSVSGSLRTQQSSHENSLLQVPDENVIQVQTNTQPRGRKCSIVTEEEDDDDDTDIGAGSDSSRSGSSHSLLNRRGSRSEGKLSHMVQELSTVERPDVVKVAPPLRFRYTPKSNALVSAPGGNAAPSKFKTLPAPTLTFSDISEESVDEMKVSAPPRVVLTRPPKPHKSRTASCSSSDASDEDSESRKKRKFKSHLPPSSRRRDSNDDSSDSGGPGHSAGGGGGGSGGLQPPGQTAGTSGEASESGNNGSGSSSGGRRHGGGGYRRRCGTAGETRLRESQSLNRITEVQESSENLLATANNNNNAVAASPRVRSKSGLGARFMLFVGGGKKSSAAAAAAPEDSKENKQGAAASGSSSSTKITKYFHLHRKLCLPLFKPANINSTSTVENVNSSVVWIPDKT
ncbi:SNF-related serine/threonine-protein kinase [Neocloeon triangulifer]|uniref:SNF-related serine/threonine-protein kinase n=1 Tax=Neocloeon triangulifer TaxID=2078957 RepID=UPI00286EE768|nr:SNF-related serine/threonine-protein kinase [Neocloeon triangulifer]